MATPDPRTFPTTRKPSPSRTTTVPRLKWGTRPSRQNNQSHKASFRGGVADPGSQATSGGKNSGCACEEVLDSGFGYAAPEWQGSPPSPQLHPHLPHDSQSITIAHQDDPLAGHEEHARQRHDVDLMLTTTSAPGPRARPSE
jgi:hypothetical protein